MTTMTTTEPIMAIRRAGLQLSAEWLNSTVVRISASGEIDASNTAEMLDYVLRRGANCRSLILDMSDITFFATAGFSALRTLDVRCSRASGQLDAGGRACGFTRAEHLRPRAHAPPRNRMS